MGARKLWALDTDATTPNITTVTSHIRNTEAFTRTENRLFIIVGVCVCVRVRVHACKTG